MTDAVGNTDEGADRPIDMQAAEFVERRDSDGWTADDEARFEEWLKQTPTHRVAFMRLNASWKRTERLAALRTAQFGRSNASPPAGGRRFLKVAMLFSVAVAIVGGLAAYLTTPRYDTYATTVGGHETLALHDGSQIELNTDTVVRVSDRANRREVWLDRGEAYFQIIHDAAHPFTVNVGHRRITDLGTKFSVRRDGVSLKVAVSEGGVRLESGDETSPPQEFVLLPGQIALASPKGVSITKEDDIGLKDDLAWRNGVLIFHRTRLADAAEEFNRYNHRKIAIVDPAVANLEIGGTFPTTDVEGFVEVSRDVLHLRVTKGNDAIRITR